MNQKKVEVAILECYKRLYLAATPAADFGKLVAEAKINEFGQKEIPFLEYEIAELESDHIIDSVVKEFRIPKYLRGRFKTTILLGCSPKYVEPKPTLVLKTLINYLDRLS